MEFLLVRSYRKSETRGVLYFEGRPWGYTLELPGKQIDPDKHCIPEGRYHVALKHSDARGWFLEIKDQQGIVKASFKPLFRGSVPQVQSVCPVVRFKESSRFSQLATLKLMDRLERANPYNDEIWLEIIGKKQKQPIR